MYLSLFIELGKITEAPLTVYNVTKGETYRFRVIQAGTIYPLRVSVDNHNITVIASDGYDVKGREVESVIVNPGERFDFLLKANQPVGSYWVRTISMEVRFTCIHYYISFACSLKFQLYFMLSSKGLFIMKSSKLNKNKYTIENKSYSTQVDGSVAEC